MSYQFFDLTRKNITNIDLENCTITGNSSQYVIKDGEITKYSIIDGKVDKSSAEPVSSVELTNYQMTFINFLKKQDNKSEVLNKRDLKTLSPEVIEEEMNKLYQEKNVYEVASAEHSKRKAGISITDTFDNSKNISIEFERIGFFKRIGNFFKNVFSGKNNEKSNQPQTEKEILLEDVFPNNVTVYPEEVYTAKGGEKPYKLANKLGVSFYRLKEENPDVNLDWVLEKGQSFVIPQKVVVTSGSVRNLADIAKVTGVSENYIKDILFGIEGRDSEPDLRPYYDGYPTQISPKGTLTIGFGHTGRVRGVEMNSQNMHKIKITREEAYEILAQDIINAKLDAIAYFGNDFINAPESVQNAIIDIVFNKGISTGFEKEGSLTNNLKHNLAEGDYASAAVNTCYLTNNKGLKKRNVYRFISSLQDLTTSERKEAMGKYETYYQNVLGLFTGNKSEYAMLEQAWQNAYEGRCHSFFS